jgi:ABC-type sugar transport system ATPase subunit
MAMLAELIRIENMTMFSNGVKLLDNFRLQVFRGEILGLIGLNDSGKSVVGPLLTGVSQADGGRMYINDLIIHGYSRTIAKAKGIFMVGRDTVLIAGMSIADNLTVVTAGSRGKFLLREQLLHQKTIRILSGLGLSLDPRRLVADLSPAQRHLVEICAAFYQGAALVVLDGIMESYSASELQALQAAIAILHQHQVAVILIDHIIDHALMMADRVSIIRRGATVGSYWRDEWDRSRLLSLMVGHEFSEGFVRTQPKMGREVLRVEGLSSESFPGMVSFSLLAGEVLGLFDLGETNARELAYTLFGMRSIQRGTIQVDGKPIHLRSNRDAIRAGIGLIPEDWSSLGLFQYLTVDDNIILPQLRRMSKFLGIFSRGLWRYLSREGGKWLDTAFQPGTLEDIHLSEVEQKRILLCRWLLLSPRVLILFKPTLGEDVVSQKIIYSSIDALRSHGIALIVVSTNIDEIMQLSDRIMIMRKDSVMDIIPNSGAASEWLYRRLAAEQEG